MDYRLAVLSSVLIKRECQYTMHLNSAYIYLLIVLKISSFYACVQVKNSNLVRVTLFTLQKQVPPIFRKHF